MELPKTFDLNNYNLSPFFLNVAISINNYELSKAGKEDFDLINYSAKILRNQSREYRESKTRMEQILKASQGKISKEKIDFFLPDNNFRFFSKMYPMKNLKQFQKQ